MARDLNSVLEHFPGWCKQYQKIFLAREEQKYKCNAALFFKSADCPRNGALVKQKWDNFKAQKTFWAQKTFTTGLFKGVTIAKSWHLGLREVKFLKDAFFPPELRRISLKPSLLLKCNIALGKQ